MKCAAVLLVAVFSTVTYAQQTHRCEDRLAHVTYQDIPCVAPSREVQPGGDHPPTAPFLETPRDAMGDWNSGESLERVPWTHHVNLAMAARVLELQKPLDDRKAAQYKENRQRCELAMRVADRCGKFAGAFYCDERGFRSIAPEASAMPVVLDNADKYEMERCALEVARTEH